MKAREGDFLETVEGLIFDAKGFCHPPNKVISYVRYVPDPQGDRKREGKSYRKIYDLKERFHFLKENYPHYVYFDPVFHREMQGVPHTNIRKIFNPSEKLLHLLDAERDPTEECAVQLARILGKPAFMGISGSVLLGMHTLNSDIDLLVYGRQHGFQTYENMKKLREKGILSSFDAEKAREKAQFRWGHCDERLIQLEKKKVLHGLFGGKEYFIRLLQGEDLVYGEVEYIPLGTETLSAVIKDDTCSIFTPCSYDIEDSSSEGVSQIVSFRGRFCEQVKKGDIVTVRGTLEKVLTEKGEHTQILLGGPDDYLFSEPEAPPRHSCE